MDFNFTLLANDSAYGEISFDVEAPDTTVDTTISSAGIYWIVGDTIYMQSPFEDLDTAQLVYAQGVIVICSENTSACSQSANSDTMYCTITRDCDEFTKRSGAYTHFSAAGSSENFTIKTVKSAIIFGLENISSLTIYDIAGRALKQFGDLEQLNEITWQANRTVSGLYIIKVESPESKQFYKLIIP
jgi:hypothetical protein